MRMAIRGTRYSLFLLLLCGNCLWSRDFATLDSTLNSNDEQREWAIQVSLDHAWAYKGYNCCGVHVPLARQIFNQDFTFKDI